MKFFIPQVKDPEQTEIVYAAIKKFVGEVTGREIFDRRIYSIEHMHEGKLLRLEVGEFDDQFREMVIAILQSEDYFFVCTPLRGVTRNPPVFVDAGDVHIVVEF